MFRTVCFLAALVGCASTSSKAPSQEIGPVFRSVSGSVAIVRTVEVNPPAFPNGDPTSAEGIGSGVLISRLGKVLTAAHLVQTAREIEVEFASGFKTTARVRASDPIADLAVLDLEEKPPEEVTVAKLGDSDEVRVGDRVFVVGAPRGISHSLTVGYVGGRRNKSLFNAGRQIEFLQTDAAINPGNSGGPMFNLKGEVVGIVSHILSASGGAEGLGFAVTSNLARHLVLDPDALWSGMTGLLLTDIFAQALNVPGGAGFLVQEVVPNSPSHRLGIQAGVFEISIGEQPIRLGGDVILEVMGIELKNGDSFLQLRSRIGQLSDTDLVEAIVLRNGEKQKLSERKGVLIAPTS